MFKGRSFFVLLFLVFCVLPFLVGCSTTTPQIKTENSTIPQPLGLTIRGTVRGANQAGITAEALFSAYLKLSGQNASGQTITREATTDTNGEYVFSSLPDGVYNISATKEGYQRTFITSISIRTTYLPADNTITTQDIALSTTPLVMTMSPAPGTTIEAAAKTFVVAFNEAMDQTSVRPTFTATGLRTYAVANTQTLTTTWSADSKNLYITTGALSANTNYQLNLDSLATAIDLAGNSLDSTGGILTGGGGFTSTVYNGGVTYYYRTVSGAAPGAPTSVMVTANSATGFDYTNVATGGNLVSLAWFTPTGSAAISGYKVYVSTSSSGPWALLSTATTVNNLDTDITTLNTALYGFLYNADCMNKLAFVTDPVYFKVLAYNAEGEGAATTITTRDAVGAGITAVHENPTAVTGMPATMAAAFTDFSAAGTNLDKGCYISFTEPMTVNAALTNTAKYTLTTGTVSTATLVYSSNGACIVKLTFSGAITPGVDTVTVSASSGPTDLSGNAMGASNFAVIIP